MNNRKRPRPIIGNRKPVEPPEESERQEPFRSGESIFRQEPTVNNPTRPTGPSRQQAQSTRESSLNRIRRNRRTQQRRVYTTNRQANRPNETSTIRSNGSSQTAAISRKKGNRIARIFLTILAILVFLFLFIFGYAKFSNLNPDLSGNIGLYDISPNAAAVASSYRIVNVAVFGIDGREDVEGDRSDTIMIGTADFEHNKLKVTSLMRDTYVEMADEDYFDKLNAAYQIGGPEESIKTINLNFDTAITDYVVVDFTALVQLVNAVGGIDIEITSEDELYWVNQYLMDVNDKVKTADPDVPGTGMQHLTGSQALAYARIRYVGNGDFERTQRQRNVLAQVVAKVSTMNPIQQINLIRSVLPYVQTSLRTSEMIKLGLNFLMMNDREIEQSRLPLDEYASTGYLHEVSYVFPNTLVDNIKSWYQFVYGIDYTPSERADEISQEIEDTWW